MYQTVNTFSIFLNLFVSINMLKCYTENKQKQNEHAVSICISLPYLKQTYPYRYTHINTLVISRCWWITVSDFV